MSYSAYLMHVIIGTATYFILRWASRKITGRREKLKSVLCFFIAIIITPAIYALFIASIISAISWESVRDFNKETWLAEKNTRHEMTDDLIKSGMLKAKAKTEVLSLLGEPDFRRDSLQTWEYDLGISTRGLGIQFNVLIVRFEGDTVARVEKFEGMD
jgi:hypothetical protein